MDVTLENDRDPSDGSNIFAPVEVDLKNPLLAALWAWLWPGAGHLYQGRTAKGVLFMVCILLTYFFGLAIGGGHVVYASFRSPSPRYAFIAQFPVGIPAFPAVIQNLRVSNGGGTLFGSDIMAPPQGVTSEKTHDQLALWHQTHGFYFELGTLYTMVAGLLNVLAIYDAYAGPVFADPFEESRRKSDESPESDQEEL